jgi:GDP-L-fucose synthase
MVLAMEKIDDFDPINLATGRARTVRDVLEILLKVDGYDNAAVEFDTTQPAMIPKRLIDASKARSELGFVPKISIEEGLERTLRWYRKSRGPLTSEVA